jgi:peptidoglycan-associated lipoprotein
MKRSFYFSLLVVVLALGLGSVGCRRKPMGPTPVPPGRTGGVKSDDGGFGADKGMTVPQGGDTANARPAGLGTDSVGGQGNRGPGGTDTIPLITDATKENPDFFKANIVYFALDRSDVRPGERSKIEAVASHLKSNPTHKVRVEGHCDERGTEGYNLALGERRALSVREYLINLGIATDRVATLSYGEARPADPGHKESAWAKNRRDEFILLTP